MLLVDEMAALIQADPIMLSYQQMLVITTVPSFGCVWNNSVFSDCFQTVLSLLLGFHHRPSPVVISYSISGSALDGMCRTAKIINPLFPLLMSMVDAHG